MGPKSNLLLQQVSELLNNIYSFGPVRILGFAPLYDEGLCSVCRDVLASEIVVEWVAVSVGKIESYVSTIESGNFLGEYS